MNLEQMMSGMGRMSDPQLQQMMQSGGVPQFLVASELQKRKTARERAATAPPTVAQDLQQPPEPPPMQGSSLPPDVVAMLRDAQSKAPPPGGAPPEGMQEGGEVRPRYRGIERDYETELRRRRAVGFTESEILREENTPRQREFTRPTYDARNRLEPAQGPGPDYNARHRQGTISDSYGHYTGPGPQEEYASGGDITVMPKETDYSSTKGVRYLTTSPYEGTFTDSRLTPLNKPAATPTPTPYNATPQDKNPTTPGIDNIQPNLGYNGDGAGGSANADPGSVGPTGAPGTGNPAADAANFGQSALGIGMNTATVGRGISTAMGALTSGIPGAITGFTGLASPSAAVTAVTGALARAGAEALGVPGHNKGMPGMADYGALANAVAANFGVAAHNAVTADPADKGPNTGAPGGHTAGVGQSKSDTQTTTDVPSDKPAPAETTTTTRGFAKTDPNADPGATETAAQGIGVDTSTPGYGQNAQSQANQNEANAAFGAAETAGTSENSASGMASSMAGDPGGGQSGSQGAGGSGETNRRGGEIRVGRREDNEVQGYIPLRYATGEDDGYAGGGVPGAVIGIGSRIFGTTPMQRLLRGGAAATAAYQLRPGAGDETLTQADQTKPNAGPPPRPAARPGVGGGGGGGGALPLPPPSPPPEQPAEQPQQQQRQQPQAEERRGMSPLQLALIQAGLGMMSSTRKSPLAALGEAAGPAMQTYLAADRTETDDLRRRQEAQMRQDQQAQQLREHQLDRQQRGEIAREGHQNQMAIAGMRGAGRGGGTARAPRPDTAMISSVARTIAARGGRTTPSPADLAAARRIVSNPALLDQVTSTDAPSAETE